MYGFITIIDLMVQLFLKPKYAKISFGFACVTPRINIYEETPSMMSQLGLSYKRNPAISVRERRQDLNVLFPALHSST
jgi:hypothetical protein